MTFWIENTECSSKIISAWCLVEYWFKFVVALQQWCRWSEAWTQARHPDEWVCKRPMDVFIHILHSSLYNWFQDIFSLHLFRLSLLPRFWYSWVRLQIVFITSFSTNSPPPHLFNSSIQDSLSIIFSLFFIMQELSFFNVNIGGKGSWNDHLWKNESLWSNGTIYFQGRIWTR